MTKTCLITGGGGFCGSHTFYHFLKHTDWNIIVTDSFRHKGKTDRISAVMADHPELAPRLKVLTHDLTVPFSEQFIHRLGQVDYIVNMASESHVDRSISDPREFIVNNINLMMTMLEYTRNNPVEKFLHVSTDEVYGSTKYGYAHPEGDHHRPSSPYAASKAAQEDIGYAYWRTYSTEAKAFPYMQTNTMNIFGELQDPEKLVPRVLQCLIKGETMPIFANKSKTAAGSRTFLHARNQADALLFVLQNVDPSNPYNGDDLPPIYNIIGDQEISNLDIALKIADYAGKKLKYELVDVNTVRPGHDLRYMVDASKLLGRGWKPPVSFEDSLKNTVEWYMENTEWLL